MLGGPGSPNANFSVSATLAPRFSGSFVREYDSELLTSGASSAHVTPASSSISAALKVDFNASTRVLSTYYDDDGATGGYAWTQLVSVDIGTGWGMSNSDIFYIQILGASKNFSVATGDGLALDNFSTSVSAIPEPSAYAAILGLLALVGCVLQRRRRSAGLSEPDYIAHD